MISSELSSHSTHSTHCPRPQCNGVLVQKPKYPYPIWSQLAFGVSFITFVFAVDRYPLTRVGLAFWFALQVVLGIILVRQRIRTKIRILRCIRCGKDL